MKSGIILFVLFLVPALSFRSFGGDEMPIPTPGLTVRTNSLDCLNQYKNNMELVSKYVTSFPATSSLKRLDVLAGGVLSNDPFQPLASGTYNTEYYSMVSTYANPSGTFSGIQLIEKDYYDPADTKVKNKFTALAGGSVRVSASVSFTGCDSSAKSKGLHISISEGSWDYNDPSPYCFFNGSFTKGSVNQYSFTNHLCNDPSRNLQALLQAQSGTAFQGKVTTLSKIDDPATPDDERSVRFEVDLSDSSKATAFINDDDLYSSEFDHHSTSSGPINTGCYYKNWPNYPYQELNDFALPETVRNKIKKEYDVAVYNHQLQQHLNTQAFISRAVGYVTTKDFTEACADVVQ